MANIRRNEQALAALGLGGPMNSLIPKPNKPAAFKKEKRKPAEPPAPSRKSARVQALPASPVYVEKELSNGRVMLGGHEEERERVVTKRSMAATSKPPAHGPVATF